MAKSINLADFIDIYDFIERDDLEAFEKLLKQKPLLISFQDRKQNTLMHLTIYRDAPKIFEYLLNQQVNFDIQDEETTTPLDLIIGEDKIEFLKLYIQYLPNSINKPNSQNTLPLYLAMLNKSYKSLEYLLQMGADPSIQNPPTPSPFIYAISIDDVKSFDLLVKNKPEIINWSYDTLHQKNMSLHELVIMGGRPHILERLIESGLNTRDLNITGGNAFIYAITNKKIEALKVLLKYFPKILTISEISNICVDCDNVEAFELFHKSGATHDKNILIKNIAKISIPMLSILLRSGVKVNYKNTDSETALRTGFYVLKSEIFKHLLLNGAKPFKSITIGHEINDNGKRMEKYCRLAYEAKVIYSNDFANFNKFAHEYNKKSILNTAEKDEFIADILLFHFKKKGFVYNVVTNDFPSLDDANMLRFKNSFPSLYHHLNCKYKKLIADSKADLELFEAYIFHVEYSLLNIPYSYLKKYGSESTVRSNAKDQAQHKKTLAFFAKAENIKYQTVGVKFKEMIYAKTAAGLNYMSCLMINSFEIEEKIQDIAIKVLLNSFTKKQLKKVLSEYHKYDKNLSLKLSIMQQNDLDMLQDEVGKLRIENSAQDLKIKELESYLSRHKKLESHSLKQEKRINELEAKLEAITKMLGLGGRMGSELVADTTADTNATTIIVYAEDSDILGENSGVLLLQALH